MPRKDEYKLTREQIQDTLTLTTTDAAQLLGVGTATITRARSKFGLNVKKGRKKILIMQTFMCLNCCREFQTERDSPIFCDSKCHREHRKTNPHLYPNSVKQREIIAEKAKERWKTPTDGMLAGIQKRMSRLDLKAFRSYRNRVKVLTERTYIENIDEINPLKHTRAVAGTEGAYHLDHKIPVKRGFVENIPPEVIADKTNLQMLPWRENIIKGEKW